MVDLQLQYQNIKSEIDNAIQEVLNEASFINGPHVKTFQKNFESYLNANHVIPCANGTDALQIAMMALNLKPGDEVIVPAFTYVATAEVIALLQLKPVMADVEYGSFNIDVQSLESAVTPKTRAIVPVHLFGQAAYMERIMAIAKKHNLYVIEDNAQAIGAEYYFKDRRIQKAGTIGDIGITSFYPSKTLGCYGDGGAIFTKDNILAEKIRMIANHGQSVKYVHDIVGCNSRLDTIQAAILDVKLKYLNDYIDSRKAVADSYDLAFGNIKGLVLPERVEYSSHVFHQYTLKIVNGKRDALKDHLNKCGVPSIIYYPIPLYNQKAYSSFVEKGFILEVTEKLCQEVLSLPIYPYMKNEDLKIIIESVSSFFD